MPIADWLAAMAHVRDTITLRELRRMKCGDDFPSIVADRLAGYGLARIKATGKAD
jgi:hypothetical protein